MSFADLKRNSSNGFEKLNQELSKLNTKTYNDDDSDKYWYPNVDKVGNGYAVIRFLPPAEGEDIPFVRIWDHSFQHPDTGLWYIEKSLTTINKADPLGEYNSKLWNSGIDADKEIVRLQKRRLTYISNVYIIKDSENPENEGKVKLFKYGKKLFDKINDVMNPQFEDEKPVNPFDFWAGANFKLKIRKVDGYRNYDKSEFGSVEPLFEDDDKLEAVWKQEQSLQELVDPKVFKTYDQLESRLNTVLGKTKSTSEIRNTVAETEEVKSAPAAKSAPAKEIASTSNDDDDDDGLDFFKRLAEED
jgi:hypothetical protein